MPQFLFDTAPLILYHHKHPQLIVDGEQSTSPLSPIFHTSSNQPHLKFFRFFLFCGKVSLIPALPRISKEPIQ